MFNEKVTLKDFFATFAHCALLFLLLVLGVEAQAQRVIYPNGKNCAEPGETVTVEFDNKVDKYFFSTDKFTSCNKGTVFWVFHFGDENCSANANASGVVKTGENVVKVRIPEVDHGVISYNLYFGESSEINIIEGLFARTTVKYVGLLSINVCTEDPIVRSKNACFCPGERMEFEVENYFNAQGFTINYEDKNNHRGTVRLADGDVKVNSKTGEGVLYWTIPSNITSDMTASFVSGSSRKENNESIVNLHLCMPRITGAPDCVKQYQQFNVSVANACSSFEYVIKTNDNNNNNEFVVSRGKNAEATITVYKFDGNKSFVKDDRRKEFFLYRKGDDVNILDGFVVVPCEVSVQVQYSIPTEINLTQGCFVGYTYVTEGESYGNKWVKASITQGRGSLRCEYQYKEQGEANFHDVLSKTVFEVGKTYKLRTLVYVDDALIQYFDSEEFTFKPYKAKVQADYGGTATVTSKYGHSNTEVALECGEAVTYQAEPTVDCYVFEKWQRYENNSWTDAGTSNPMMFFAESNVQYKAVFKQKQNYTVAAVPNNPTLGEVSLISNNNKFTSGSQTTYCNQPVTISAKSLGCGKFKRWSDGNTEASRNFNVKEDIDLVAVFEEDTQKPVLICTSDNLTQTICKGDAIDPIFIESTTSKIKDVADLVDGLVVEHVKRSDDPNADKDYVHCSEYFKLERDYDNGGNMKVNFTKDQDYCKTLPNQKLKVVFYDDVNNKQVKLEVLLDCQTHKLDLSQCQDFYPGGLDADVTFYLEAEVEEGKTCGSLFNTDQGTFGGIEEIRPGDAIKISGTPTVGDGTYTFEVETDEKSCIDGTAKLDVNITVVGPAEIECNEAYAALSADGSVSFPLGSIATGEAESWKVSGNFTLTDGIISSKAALPFGVPVPITVAAVKCKQESLCHSTITLIKQVAPCEP